MQVGVEEGEKGKLGDDRFVGSAGDGPAGVPVPLVDADGQRLAAKDHLHRADDGPHPRRQAGDGALEGFQDAFGQFEQEQVDFAQVAQDGHEQGAHQRPQNPPVRQFALPPGDQVVGDAKGAQGRHGEPGGDGQVVGHIGHDADELDQRADHHLAEIVVIQIPPGEPGIVRRKLDALDDGVEIGQVHRLFAAHPGMPQVGVAPADEPKEEKEGQE